MNNRDTHTIDNINEAIIAIDRAHQMVCHLFETFESMDGKRSHPAIFMSECRRQSEFPAITVGLLNEARDILLNALK